jgi:hypothetical protein
MQQRDIPAPQAIIATKKIPKLSAGISERFTETLYNFQKFVIILNFK